MEQHLALRNLAVLQEEIQKMAHSHWINSQLWGKKGRLNSLSRSHKSSRINSLACRKYLKVPFWVIKVTRLTLNTFLQLQKHLTSTSSTRHSTSLAAWWTAQTQAKSLIWPPRIVPCTPLQPSLLCRTPISLPRFHINMHILEANSLRKTSAPREFNLFRRMEAPLTRSLAALARPELTQDSSRKGPSAEGKPARTRQDQGKGMKMTRTIRNKHSGYWMRVKSIATWWQHMRKRGWMRMLTSRRFKWRTNQVCNSNRLPLMSNQTT